MPRVDIWIRKEDWQKWQSIKNKPEWLHEHLNNRNVGDNELLIVDTNKLIIEPTLTPPENAA